MAKKQTQKQQYEELLQKYEDLENETKKQKSKNKKKTIIAVSVSVPTVLIAAATTAIVLTSSKTQTWSFTQDDYVNLRQSIINSRLSVEELRNQLLNFFKTNLKASNKDISSLIENVIIKEQTEKSIIFNVTLNTKNNSYLCIQDEKFYISNNQLTIEYSGTNKIDFPTKP